MPDGVERITRPLGNVVRDVGLAVAEGQQALDEALDRTYRREGDDGVLDWGTPWYRFAEVEVDLQLYVYTHEEEEGLDGASDRMRQVVEERRNVAERPPRYGLTATPATPSGSTLSEHETGGASRIHFRIVPVTPPATVQRDTTDDENQETVTR
jgi:hypothetical protein